MSRTVTVVRGFLLAAALLPRSAVAQTPVTLPFEESFEDASYTSRNWYDAPQGALSTAQHLSGSTASYECRFLEGAEGCSGGNPGRLLFEETDSVYLSFHVKHSSSWMGSNRTYHPHMFMVMTNQDGEYVGPACTRLTSYTEENQGYPQLCIQDGTNIDESRIGENLIGVTEQRAVAGCNGTQSDIGYDLTDCYSATSTKHWNGICWKGPAAVYFDPTQKVGWHHVESYFQLNTIAGGIGQPDGVVRYWLDGQAVIDHRNVILRTGQHPAMKFNQLLMAFYIGDGAPADETIWIDDLRLDRAPSGTGSQCDGVTNCAGGDGCCPIGCTAANDGDCGSDGGGTSGRASSGSCGGLAGDGASGGWMIWLGLVGSLVYSRRSNTARKKPSVPCRCG
jgi:hypothetical protein